MAADNGVAQKLYRKTGYNVTYKTDDGLCHCLMSRMLKSFLGHPVGSQAVFYYESGRCSNMLR